MSTPGLVIAPPPGPPAGLPIPSQDGGPQHFLPPPGAPAGGVPPGAGGFPPAAGGYPPGAAGQPLDPKMHTPSAPSLDRMDSITGYTETNFDGAMAPPPSYLQAMASEAPERAGLDSDWEMSEDLVKMVLVNHVESFTCYGKSAARNMRITSLKNTAAFHYTLETFAEKRSTAWAFEPYTGQAIDGPHNGVPPPPWEVHVNYPDKFTDSTTQVDVPHTSSVKQCHACNGAGRMICGGCRGQGMVICDSCLRYNVGYGRRRCYKCRGRGFKTCDFCGGGSMVFCPTCGGKCQVRCFIRLTVFWKNHKSEFIKEYTALPDHLVKKVSGKVVFEEENKMVWPVSHIPEDAINAASLQLTENHKSIGRSERILLQRHKVRAVPVAEVACKFRDITYSYCVYGSEAVVHAPDYPQKTCFGCAVC